jgi:putative DNA primase/helicase
MTADELLAREAEKKPNANRTQRDEAAEWIRERLNDGPVPSKTLFTDAVEFGFTPKTLRTALRSIGCKSNKSSMDGPWLWSLPVEQIASTPAVEPRNALESADWSSLFPTSLPEDAPKFPKMPEF